MTRLINRILNAAPYLMIAVMLVRLAVLVTISAAADVLAASVYPAALQFVIAFVLLAFAGQAWRSGLTFSPPSRPGSRLLPCWPRAAMAWRWPPR